MDVFNNKEMLEKLKNYIRRMHGGSVVEYCKENDINYSGLSRALNLIRPLTNTQIAPLNYKKETKVFYVRILDNPKKSK